MISGSYYNGIDDSLPSLDPLQTVLTTIRRTETDIMLARCQRCTKWCCLEISAKRVTPRNTKMVYAADTRLNSV